MADIRIPSGDQMRLPRGHFTGTEGRKKTVQQPSVVEQNLYKYSK